MAAISAAETAAALFPKPETIGRTRILVGLADDAEPPNSSDAPNTSESTGRLDSSTMSKTLANVGCDSRLKFTADEELVGARAICQTGANGPSPSSRTALPLSNR